MNNEERFYALLVAGLLISLGFQAYIPAHKQAICAFYDFFLLGLFLGRRVCPAVKGERG